MNRRMRTETVFLLGLVALGAAGALGGWLWLGSPAMAQLPGLLRTHLDQWGMIAAAAYTAVFALLGAMGVPPAALMLPAIWAWPRWTALWVSLGGGLGSSVLGFWASRHWLRQWVEPRIPPHVRRFEVRLESHGFSTVVVLRLLFYLLPPVNWLLGISHIPLNVFVLGTFIGALPGTLILVFTGHGAFHWLAGLPPWALVLVGVLAAANLAGWAWLLSRPAPARQPGDTGVTALLFAETLGLYARLAWRSFFGRGQGRPRPSRQHLLIMSVFLPAFAFLEAVHWLAFCLDEWLFPRYRQTPLGEPLFIVGIPRSGTTFLHRVLANDTARFTCFTLWELVLAPAIIERKAVWAASRVDRMLGRPFERMLRGVAGLCTGGMKAVHKLALEEPEEDFLLLLPVLACFILTVPFPHDPEIADLAYFDQRVDPQRRRRLMAFYQSMVRRHLYAHGGGRTLLSKNVSFTPLLASLLEAFPGCRLAVCTRDPAAAVPSQISAMEGPWRLFGNPMDNGVFRERWVGLMRHYYAVQRNTLLALPPSRARLLRMDALQSDLEGEVHALYAAFGYEPSPAFLAQLHEEAEKAKAYRSQHVYSCMAYGLSAEVLEEQFAPLYDGGADPRQQAPKAGSGGQAEAMQESFHDAP